MAEYIVRNAIIDNQDQKGLKTTDFVIGALETRSLDDRYIMISFDTLNAKTVVVVNEKSRIENPDVECSNGYIQGVDRVLQPSNDKLPDLIKGAPNMKIFSRLLEETGFADSMNLVRDEDYEVNHAEYGPNLDKTAQIPNPDHRYYGFTAFVETDSVFMEKWGVSAPDYRNDVFVNWQSVLSVIKEQCLKVYPGATAEDLKDPNNAVHQFVAYHLVPARMSWEKMVIHMLEMGYGFSNPNNYFERMDVSDESWLVYLPYHGPNSQCNYQADEMNIRGQYDLTFRLPPVPFEGTWQFRICAPCNAGFGMAQFYLGKEKYNLQAIGLPVDLRLPLSNPSIGWEPDDDDPEVTRQIDKNMLNHGYIKPPRHDGISRNGAPVTESMRNSTTYRANLRVRKIVWTGNMKPEETMYLRVKSVLTNPFACFLLDYMEWVPKNVYNGVEEEDQW